MKLLRAFAQLVSSKFYIKQILRLKSFLQEHKVVTVGVVFLAVATFFIFAPEELLASKNDSAAKKLAKASVSAFVSLQQYVVQFLGYVVYYLVIIPLGWFIILLFQVLTAVASYNEFMTSAAVTKGWVIVRDMANMVVIVFLVIVAFSMILGYEAYGNRKTLARLLIMAVLINFSKTICGIFIDISQVVMLTFVSGFKFISGVSLVQGMQLDKMMKLGSVPKNGNIPTLVNALASVVLAAMFMFTILVVIIVIIMTLIWRIVNLWMLVILSPLAFLASAFSVGPLGRLYGQWQSKFVDFLINGPILAFFLWLALTIMNGLQQVNSGSKAVAAQSGIQGAFAEAGGVAGATLTEAFTGGNVMILMISIGLLVVSLVLAESFGAVGATAAVGKIKGVTKGALKKGLKYTAKAQDTALGIATSTLTGRSMNLASAGRVASKFGKKAGLSAQKWYYERGQATAQRGGVFGEWSAARNRRKAAEKGVLVASGKFNTPKEEMQAVGQNLEDIRSQKTKAEAFNNYDKDVSTLAGYKSVQQLAETGNTKQADDLANKLGIKDGAAGITGEMIQDQASKVQAARDKLQKDYSSEDIEEMEKTSFAGIVRVTDGKVSVSRYQSLSSDDFDKMARNAKDGRNKDFIATIDDDIEKAQAYYDDLSKLNLSRTTGTEFLRGKQILAENAQKRQEQYASSYGNLNNESEIAGHLANAKSSNNQDAMRYLFKQAIDQGMLKGVAKQFLGKDVNMAGLRKAFNYDADASNVRADDADFFESIAKAGKEAGMLGFASGVGTNASTGQVYFADVKKSSTYPGMSEQEAMNLEKIKKRQMKIRDMYDAMVQSSDDGSFELSELGRRAVQMFGENFKEDIRLGTSGAAFDEAIMKEMDRLRQGTRNSDNSTSFKLPGGDQVVYTQVDNRRLSQLTGQVSQKRAGGNSDYNRRIVNDRGRKIDELQKIEDSLNPTQVWAKDLDQSFVESLKEQAMTLRQEIQDINRQIGVTADSLKKFGTET